MAAPILEASRARAGIEWEASITAGGELSIEDALADVTDELRSFADNHPVEC
jgi:hypothetical protein